MLDDLTLLPEGRGLLLVEFGGGQRRKPTRRPNSFGRLAEEAARQAGVPHLQRRRSATASGTCASPALGATAFVPGKTHALGRLGGRRRAARRS